MVAGRAREFPREMDGALRLAPSDIVAASFLKPGAVVRRRRRNRNNRSNRSNRSNRNNHSRNRDRQRQRSDDPGFEIITVKTMLQPLKGGRGAINFSLAYA